MQQHQRLSITTWENPTKNTQTFEIHHGPGAEPDVFILAPGDAADVLSLYDDAIRTVRGGVVVGGLAPLLVPKGRKEVPVHEAIAKAASLGDAERKIVSDTGASAGSSGLEAVAVLAAKNAALEAKVEQLMAMITQPPMAPPAPPVAEEPVKTSPMAQPQQSGSRRG